MSFYSFLQGYNDEQRHQSDMKTAEVARRASLQDMEFRRQEQPLNLQAKKLRNALDSLDVRFGQATQPLKIDEFKGKMEDSIREYKLRADLDPKVRQLANVKADSDIASMQNSLSEAELSRAVTPEQFNALLAKQGAPYKVQAGDNGKFALIGADGKQIGDQVSLEQLSYSLQNPQAYNKVAYDNLAQLALAQARQHQSDGYAVIPPDMSTTSVKTQTPSGGTLNIPNVLGGTPKASPLVSSTNALPQQSVPQQPTNVNLSKALTLSTPVVGVIPATSAMRAAIGTVRTAKDMFRQYIGGNLAPTKDVGVR